jgi:hypothetical protein
MPVHCATPAQEMQAALQLQVVWQLNSQQAQPSQSASQPHLLLPVMAGRLHVVAPVSSHTALLRLELGCALRTEDQPASPAGVPAGCAQVGGINSCVLQAATSEGVAVLKQSISQPACMLAAPTHPCFLNCLQGNPCQWQTLASADMHCRGWHCWDRLNEHAAHTPSTPSKQMTSQQQLLDPQLTSSRWLGCSCGNPSTNS